MFRLSSTKALVSQTVHLLQDLEKSISAISQWVTTPSNLLTHHKIVFTSNTTFFLSSIIFAGYSLHITTIRNSKSLSNFKKSFLVAQKTVSTIMGLNILHKFVKKNSSKVFLSLQSAAMDWIWNNLSLFTSLPQFYKWKINSPGPCFKNEQLSTSCDATVAKLLLHGDESLDLVTKTHVLNASD